MKVLYYTNKIFKPIILAVGTKKQIKKYISNSLHMNIDSNIFIIEDYEMPESYGDEYELVMANILIDNGPFILTSNEWNRVDRDFEAYMEFINIYFENISDLIKEVGHSHYEEWKNINKAINKKVSKNENYVKYAFVKNYYLIKNEGTIQDLENRITLYDSRYRNGPPISFLSNIFEEYKERPPF